MIEPDFGPKLAAVYLALLLFGIGFNTLYAWLDRQGYTHGFLSLLVAAGVAVTVGMTAVINVTFALVTAGAFIASGVPMIIGSVARYVRAREKMIETLKSEVRNNDDK